jgi:hypothetical protein
MFFGNKIFCTYSKTVPFRQFTSSTMATSNSAGTKRPRKRRKTAGGHPLYEDDDDAADAVLSVSRIRQTQQGPVEERYEVPMWPEPPAPIEAEDQATPCPDPAAFNMPEQEPYLPFEEHGPEFTNTAKV